LVHSSNVICRIDRAITGNGAVVFGISGRITTEDLDTLRDVMEAEALPLVIDLNYVELVDRAVVKFLARRELDGILLHNCSPYIREWVTRERKGMVEMVGNIEDA
jgi:hypothetical protein